MSGYIGPQPVPQATQHREAFTATASQTSFATVGYTPQFVDVYLNGVKLAAADYTATNGSDIVLTTGAALDDILEYVAYTPFEVADQTFTGTTTVTDSGAAPLVANRTTSDGDITTFQKDGTTVGSIGTTGGYLTVTASGGSDAGLKLGNSAVFPCNTDGSDRDAGINLGLSTGARFKDLYLSGGVYLGGTGAANYLDDYEEGTWTPTGLSNITINSVENASYTKVGRTVTVMAWLKVTQSANTFEIGGLPFTAAGRSGASLSELANYLNNPSQVANTTIYGYGANTAGASKDFVLTATYDT